MMEQEELRSLLRESARSRTTHRRSEARLLKLAKKNNNEDLVYGDGEGSLLEHLRRVLASKRREDRVMTFYGRVASSLDPKWLASVCELCREACVSLDAAARTRGCELIGYVLCQQGLSQQGIDDELHDTLVALLVERIKFEKTSAVRAAACWALKRLQREDDDEREPCRAREALAAACEDSSAEVRKAAVDALDPCTSNLDVLVRRCRDVDASVRKIALECVRDKVHPKRLKDWASLVHTGLCDRDDAVRLAAALTAFKFIASLGIDRACDVDDEVAVKAAVGASHACAVALAVGKASIDPPRRKKSKQVFVDRETVEAALRDDENVDSDALQRALLLDKRDNGDKMPTKRALRFLAEVELEARRLPPADLDDVLRTAIDSDRPRELDDEDDYELAIVSVKAKLVDEASRRHLYQAALQNSSESFLALSAARLACACAEGDLDTVLNDLMQVSSDNKQWRLEVATEACGIGSKVSEETLAVAEREIWLPAVSSADAERREVGVVGLGRRLSLSTNWSLGPLLWRVASNALEEARVRAVAVKALADAAMVARPPPNVDFWKLLRKLVRDDDDVASVAAAEAAVKLVMRFGSDEDVVVDLVCDLAVVGLGGRDDRLKQLLAVFVASCQVKRPETLAACVKRRLLDKLANGDDEWYSKVACPKQMIGLFSPAAPFDAAYGILCQLYDGEAALSSCFSVIPPPEDKEERKLLAVLLARIARSANLAKTAKKFVVSFAKKLDEDAGLDDDQHYPLDTDKLLERELEDDSSVAPRERSTRRTNATTSYRDDEDDDTYFARLRKEKKEAAAVLEQEKSMKSGISQKQKKEEEEDVVCSTCAKGDRPNMLLLCDSCPRGFHIDCLDPPLEAIPDGDWFCPFCRIQT